MRRKLEYTEHVLRGSSREELKTMLFEIVARKNFGRGRKICFFFDDAWKLIQNDELNETPLC